MIFAQRESVSVSIEEALEDLDDALEKSDRFIMNKRAELDSLAVELRKSRSYGNRRRVYGELIQGYWHFNIDSAMCLIDSLRGEALKSGDTLTARMMDIRRLELYPLKAKFYEAYEGLNRMDTAELSDMEKIAFYKSARMVALYELTFRSRGAIDPLSLQKFLECNRKVLDVITLDDPEYLLYKGIDCIAENRLSLAVAQLTEYAKGMEVDDPRMPNVLSMLALCYYMRQRYDEWLYCSIKCTESEVIMSMLDGENMRQVAGAVFSRGDVNHAYRYIIHSDRNVALSGALLRSISINNQVPLINAAFVSIQKSNRQLLVVVLVGLGVILILVTLLYTDRQKEQKQLNRIKTVLSEANKVKESYLGEFLALCSTYMDKIEDFNKMVGRKMAAGQIDELYNLVRAGSYVEEQRVLFFEIFDDAFMHIYPTFIDDVNMLLLPERKIAYTPGMGFSPELRILALMRLGLDDGTKIARFLGLSVNTVYSYRNRMKNRAADKANFEANVMSIGLFE